MRVTIIRTAAAIALGLGLGGCASGGMGGQHAGMHGGHMMMMSMGPLVGCHGAGATPDAALASLHAALGVTAEQEALWATYAAAYTRHAGAMKMDKMGAADAAGHQAHAVMPVPERLGMHEEMMSTHLASLHELRTALAPLYASLSAEQKAAADAMRCERAMH